MLSVREKVNLLLKMQRFEMVFETSLQQTYMEMIYKVYVDPKTTREEQRLLQPCFFMGLRSRSVVIRRSFFDVFNRSMSHANTLQARLYDVFGTHDYNVLTESNWVRQALDLMLGVAVTGADAQIVFSSGIARPVPLLMWYSCWHSLLQYRYRPNDSGRPHWKHAIGSLRE